MKTIIRFCTLGATLALVAASAFADSLTATIFYSEPAGPLGIANVGPYQGVAISAFAVDFQPSGSATGTVRWEANLTFNGSAANRPTSVSVAYRLYSYARGRGTLNAAYYGPGSLRAQGKVKKSGGAEYAGIDTGTIYAGPQDQEINAEAGPLLSNRSATISIPTNSWVLVNGAWKTTVILENVDLSASASFTTGATSEVYGADGHAAQSAGVTGVGAP